MGDTPGVPPTAPWSRVWLLSGPNAVLFPPNGAPQSYDYCAKGPSLHTGLHLVVAEQGGGRTTFVQSLGHRPRKPVFEAQSLAEAAQRLRELPTGLRAVVGRASRASPDEIAKFTATVEKVNDHFRDWTVVVVGGPELLNAMNVDWSALVPLARITARIEPLPATDMSSVIESLEKPFTLPADVHPQIVDWTGGQPLLTKVFLDELGRRHREEPGPYQIEALGEWLCDHPPPVVSIWQRHLAEMILGSSDVREQVRLYASGGTEGKVQHLERELFTSGWLRPVSSNSKGLRWGFSRCHQEYARQPLYFPERLARAGGGGR